MSIDHRCPTSSTNQSAVPNTTNSSASSLSDISVDNNQTLSPLSSFTAGLDQNSTNSSLPVKTSNATNLAQKQDLISSYIQQHQPSSGADVETQQNQQLSQSYLPPAQQQQLQQQQQPLSQSQPQSYTSVPPPMQQPLQQQQPFDQPYPVPAPPLYTIPYNPSLTQPTEIPPRILSDNNYVDSIGCLRINSTAATKCVVCSSCGPKIKKSRRIGLKLMGETLSVPTALELLSSIPFNLGQTCYSSAHNK